MNIVILGAGQVGASLANVLVSEQHNVTIVDNNAAKLSAIRERLDVGTVHGHASHPDILRAANCLDADMVVAVTNNDETNMIACQVAFTVFSTPMKIARVRSENYQANQELFTDEAIPIDVIIVPEHLVSDYVTQLISHPGARQVVEFADGKLHLITVRVDVDALVANSSIGGFIEKHSSATVKVLTIYRNKNRIKIDNKTVFKPNDEVILAVYEYMTAKIIKEFQCNINPYRSIIIAGGGNIGYALAKNLEKKYYIKIIDPGETRVNFLAENLEKALVIKGDASDSELLLDENIAQTDLFCAVTNNDGINIMSSLLAKRAGARKVISLITRGSYSELIAGSEIDAAFSPQHITVSALLRHIRRGDVVQAHSIKEGAMEALELIVHGDEKTSEVVGKKIQSIVMPRETELVAIERKGNIIMEFSDVDVIESNDKLVILLLNKAKIKEVEKLFQVAAIFL